MDQVITQEQALVELKKGYSKAEVVLQNREKLNSILERLEKKLRKIPKIGETLSHIPVLVQMVKSYITKEYTLVPIGSIVAIISALLYFISPVDLIPDFIPGIGHLDDAAVIAACLVLVNEDVKEYQQWRDGQKSIIPSTEV